LSHAHAHVFALVPVLKTCALRRGGLMAQAEQGGHVTSGRPFYRQQRFFRTPGNRYPIDARGHHFSGKNCP
jgi:hypothetical protein